MKAKKFIAAILAAVMVFGMTENFAFAAETESSSGGYHYDQLSELAKVVYDGIGRIDLATGTAEHDLASDLDALPSNTELTRAMDAARYAYYADHPEVFYVNFPKLTLRITQDASGSKHVYIGSGRNASYLVDAFADKTAVQRAVTEFNARVNAIVDGAKVLTVAEGGSLQAAQIKYVHNEIISHVSYRLEDTAYVGNASLLGTPYGVLVKKQGVCEGYARAFKTVMDKLGINCILVQGVHQYDGEVAVSHMWNYVEITDDTAARAGGRWYAVDATLDDPEIPIVADSEHIRERNKYYNHFDEYGKDGFEQEKYLLAGQLTMSDKHFESEEVAAAGGYRFAYPVLEEYDFMVTGVSNDLDGFKVITKDVPSSVVAGEKITAYQFSYLGMTVSEAREKGIYLVWRYYKEENGEIVPYYGEYGSWFYIDTETYSIKEENGYTTIQENKVPYVEIAATTVPPEKNPDKPYVHLTYQGDDSGLIARTGKIYNKNQSKYVPPPFILRQTPTQTVCIFISDKFYHITVEYDDKLMLADGYKSVEDVRTKITCRSRLGADVTGDKYSEIKNFKWDGDRTVEFDMKFSMMYADDNVIYSVYIEGLVGEASGKSPNPICYSAQQKIVCPSIMERNGNWDIFAKPTLLESDDLSMQGWETSNGQQVSDLLKDRLTLVTTKTTEKQNEQISEQVEDKVQDNIISSATYNITLSICKMAVVKTGHKVKVRLGFPDGYGPDDEGVTFKAYHFKRDDQGNVIDVEEIGCVVTQYGLIITCDAFSPFMIAAVEKDETAPENKTVVVTTSDGGSVSGDGLDATGIVSLSEGGSQTMTFTARDGYQIESITACGKDIAVTNDKTMTVTVSGDDVQNANNIVNANFVAREVAAKDEDKGQTPVKPTAEAAVITDMPASKSVAEGGTLKIAPTVAGQTDSVQTFQWYKDGVKLEGRISKYLDIKNVKTSDAGSYTLKVTTTVGTVSAEAESDACSVTVIPRPRPIGGGSSSATASDPEPVSYDVSVNSAANGTVSVSTESAEKGDTVMVTVAPNDGYELRELLVLDKDGCALKLTEKGNNKYVFTMPDGRATVVATFAESAAADAEDAGVSFADVTESAYYYDAVVWAVEKGITNGITADEFRPNVSCTRAQMVTFLWRAAGSPKVGGSSRFADVAESAYYYDAVMWAVEKGITNGITADEFRPNSPCTRAQTVTFLYRANGSPDFQKSSFADVAADAYYADAVAWAKTAGITAGVGNNSFNPNAYCTRGQIVTFLHRDAR